MHNPLLDDNILRILINLFFILTILSLTSLNIKYNFLRNHRPRITLQLELFVSFMIFIDTQKSKPFPILKILNPISKMRIILVTTTLVICLSATEISKLAPSDWIFGIIMPLRLRQIPVALPLNNT